ncbi:SusC/RagA family TonB-linked outer membrane protein [Pararhodonellum marinum]|uniref:SusC/RagA family TonB-linked outer membrane protein n=1 Tax=Pararhodonellum marinum TaxID=2755358 RepID=UPI00188F6A8B|nr:SusC/RagA family TonB-linked outer membrane protein [Pararhodonellum marinum]
MRKILLTMLSLVLTLSIVLEAQSQTRVLTGKVVSGADGFPIPGVNVIDKANNTGTVTDLEGNYSISVTNATTLVISFIGYATQEVLVGNRSTLDIEMAEDLSELSEVVVTSFGMERDKKSLGYSVTQLEGDRFTESRTVNLGNALSGKIAGVNVSPPATGAAGSTRVVIRGGSSLTGNDQPLYVVNGIPINNSNLGSAGMWGGNDSGDGLSAINPDDIESISVLKGSTAAALYGVRASNGVVMITTKTGKSRKGIGVTFNSNTTMDRVWDMTDFQNVYGPGRDGLRPSSSGDAFDIGQTHWGERYDGASTPQFDGVSRPYSHLGQGLNSFYQNAYTLNNSIAFSGGNETGTYRFSFSDLDNKDIMPNAGFKRRVANVSVNSKLNKFTVAVTGQYSKENGQNRPRLSDSPGNANFSMMTFPGNLPLSAIQGDPNKLGAMEDGTELRYQPNVFQTNPYWAAYQFSRQDQTDRFMGNASLTYNITDWLYVQGRVGTDFSSRVDDTYEPYGTAYKPLGDFNQIQRNIREDNADFFIGVDKTFGDFSIDAMVGGNRMRQTRESLQAGGNDLVVPFLHTLRNVAAPSVNYNFSELGINSIFASANVGYKNFVFLNVTAREDQFSTLSPDSFKLFYPSVGTSFVFSEAFEMPSFVTFGKIRASYAGSGGGAPGPYALLLTYGLVGQGHLGSSLGQINNGSIPNNTLQPFSSNEFEIGADLRFFSNRLGLDVAYYSRRTTDDILATGISSTSGFGSTTVNIGELTNRGVELLLSVNPVRSANFNWDLSLNFASNISNVVSLGTNAAGDPIEFINLGQSRLMREQIRHVVGQPLGMIAGFRHLEENGQRVYTDEGYPVTTPGLETLAEGRHPISAGLFNNMSYKNWRLSFLIDMRQGGSLVSGTNYSAHTLGLHQNTLVGREGGLSFSGVNQEGTPTNFTIPAVTGDPDQFLLNDYYTRWAMVTENIVYDASFAKLREFSLGYSFPSTMLSKTPFEALNLSLVGRNLLLLWSSVPNIDPESAYAVDGNSQGLEFFAMPTTRSFGFNLTASF